MSLTRREFIQWLSTLGTALAASPVSTNTYLPNQSKQHKNAIPSSGERLPIVGLGTWITFGIDPDDPVKMKQREAVMREFFKLGGGVLDSSPMYGNAEQVIGLLLKKMKRHDRLFSATKVWTHGDRQGFLQMEHSRLLWGLPTLDLMQVHNLMDWETHLPSLRAMKEEGVIRYIGVTTSHGRRHEELIRIMQKERLDFVQFTYNLLDREAEKRVLPMAADNGIAVIINRPFQRGDLFDYVAGHTLPAWASDIDCKSWAQFFLKFIISHPSVTCAIPATSRVDHLQENMEAGYGALPDKKMRNRMIKAIQSI
jgi:diketogulonate reductase-like aldo/keto reductase